jgi:hypothetical protein
MSNVIKLFANPFILIYEEIFEQPTLLWKIWQTILFVWVTGLFLLFVVGFITLVYGLLSGEADLNNATFGVFDTLGY